MNGLAPRNGNGNDWVRWLNTVLIVVVGSLLSVYISGNERRIARLEDEMMRIALIQASRAGQLDMIEQEMVRLRAVQR